MFRSIISFSPGNVKSFLHFLSPTCFSLPLFVATNHLFVATNKFYLTPFASTRQTKLTQSHLRPLSKITLSYLPLLLLFRSIISYGATNVKSFLALIAFLLLLKKVLFCSLQRTYLFVEILDTLPRCILSLEPAPQGRFVKVSLSLEVVECPFFHHEILEFCDCSLGVIVTS